jgi:voltage-gated potassium channel
VVLREKGLGDSKALGDIKVKLVKVIALVSFIIAVGTAGYMVIEGWSFLDSVYMTTITLATVGYREVQDLSPGGMIFTILLIIGGMSIFLYALTVGGRFLLEGEFRKIFWRKKLEKTIHRLKGHYIICGYGRMGKIVAKELREEGAPFVVIDNSPHVLEEENLPFIQGDATHDSVLKEAGIEKAKGLIVVLDNDAENLYVVLSARGLNPSLLIVARAMEEDSERKLLRAGANQVVSPYHIGGVRMAQTVLKPTVVDFVEFATRSGNIELQLQEIEIHKGSSFVGSTLETCGIGRDLGVIIVAIKQATGDTRFNPTFRSVIQEGDKLIALGEMSKLKAVEEMAKSKV